jgi:uracil-DNA glycosylase
LGAVSEREQELAVLNDEVRTCTRCPLAETRIRAVPGEGPIDAEIMFIGEGPGFHEDRQGRPFVGPSGQFLQELLASIGLQRSQVYITNVVKCRPPNNRDPQPSEIEACMPYYLDRQIDLIDPKVIVTLGRFSMSRFFPGKSITRIHGQPKQEGRRIIFPMFHPAAALHQPHYREMIEQDILKVPALLEEMRSAQQAPAPSVAGARNQAEPEDAEPQQLSLF